MVWLPLILSAVVQIVGIAFFAGQHAQFKRDVERRLTTLEAAVESIGEGMGAVREMMAVLKTKVGLP